MSAFIVSHETINAAVSAFHPMNGRFIPCEQSDELGRRLWDMNHEAIKQRYGEEEPKERFRYRPHNYSRFEILAALRCLRYQCSEGKVPEFQLYDELRQKIERLALEIVNDIPEYAAVPWDLPDPSSYRPQLIETAADAAAADSSSPAPLEF